MSNSTDVPGNKHQTLWAIIGLLIMILGSVIFFGKKMLDQKDEVIKDSRSLYQTEISRANEITRKLEGELAQRETELRDANKEKQQNFELYQKYEEQAITLENALRDLKNSANNQGSAIDLNIELAHVKGEMERYKAGYDNALAQIALLEVKVRSLEADLSAAVQQIALVRDSLTLVLNEKSLLADQLVQKNEISLAGIKAIEEATSYEIEGDALPGRKKFNSDKFVAYQKARSLLIGVRQTMVNEDILTQTINRLTAKMETLVPGSSQTEDYKGF